jgi:probable F420-dependent oxidoreductase
MKIGITIPNNFGVEDPQYLCELAMLAEDLGYFAIFSGEHLIHTQYVTDRLGSKPYFHPLAILSFVAARTTRIELGQSVIALPLHHPVELAKYTATLDHLSRGRVILGAGTGYAPEEFAAMNIPFEERGTRTDETLEILKKLWSDESTSFEGRHWTLRNVRAFPKAYHRTTIPVWVGGMSRRAKLRAAQFGDGWQPTGISVEEFSQGVREVRHMVAAAGRDPGQFAICMRYNIGIEGEHYNELERRTLLAWDDTAEIGRITRAYEDGGATSMMFALNSSNATSLEKAVRRIARELLP